MSHQFILAPGEEFLQCPYNLSHKITNARMLTHLDKCRKAYLKSPDGQRCQMKVCQYNTLHHIPNIELELHEQTCPDKANVLRYLTHHTSKEANKFYDRRRKEELEKRVVKQERYDDEDIEDWQEVRRHRDRDRDRDRHRNDRDGYHHHRSSSPTPGPSSSGGGNSWDIEEENWEDEACGYQPGYDPKIKLKQEPVLYNPAGLTKTERKKFRLEVRSRHAARSMGEKMDFPLANDYETKPELMAQEDKKLFPESSATVKVERIGSPELGELIDSDEDDIEVIDFNGQEVPPATASSSKAAYLDIKPTITPLTMPTPSCLHTTKESDQQQSRRASTDLDREPESTSDEQRENTNRSPPNSMEGAGATATNDDIDLDAWPWPNDDSDIWPNDTDDFPGRDPYA